MKPLDAPLQLYWTVNYECNMRCAHCYAAEAGRPNVIPMEAEKWRAALSDARKCGVLQLFLTGGEPFLRPDLLEIVSYASSLRMGVSIATNGSYLTPDIVSALKAAGVTEVQISLDAGAAALHDAFRRHRGAFESALRAISLLRAAAIKTRVNTVITDSTIDELPAIRDLLKERGISAWTVTVPADAGRGVSVQVTPETIRKLLHIVGREAAEWTPRPHLDEPCVCRTWLLDRAEYPLLRPQVCASGRSIAAMRPDGFLTACLMDPILIGRLPEQSLREVWHGSPRLLELRAGRARLQGACAACPKVELCGGGCRAHVLATGGCHDGSDDKCLGRSGYGVAANL